MNVANLSSSFFCLVNSGKKSESDQKSSDWSFCDNDHDNDTDFNTDNCRHLIFMDLTSNMSLNKCLKKTYYFTMSN